LIKPIIKILTAYKLKILKNNKIAMSIKIIKIFGIKSKNN